MSVSGTQSEYIILSDAPPKPNQSTLFLQCNRTVCIDDLTTHIFGVKWQFASVYVDLGGQSTALTALVPVNEDGPVSLSVYAIVDEKSPAAYVPPKKESVVLVPSKNESVILVPSKKESVILVPPKTESAALFSSKEESGIFVPSKKESAVILDSSIDESDILVPQKSLPVDRVPSKKEYIVHVSSKKPPVACVTPKKGYVVRVPQKKAHAVRIPPRKKSIVHVPPIKRTVVHVPKRRKSTVHAPQRKNSTVHVPQIKNSAAHVPPRKKPVVWLPPKKDITARVPPKRDSTVPNKPIDDPPDDVFLIGQFEIDLSQCSEEENLSPSQNLSIKEYNIDVPDILRTENQKIPYEIATQEAKVPSRENVKIAPKKKPAGYRRKTSSMYSCVSECDKSFQPSVIADENHEETFKLILQNAPTPISALFSVLDFPGNGNENYNNYSSEFSKKFLCSFCGVGFGQRYKWKNHVQIHIGPKLHKCFCPNCGVCYRDYRTMRKRHNAFFK